MNLHPSRLPILSLPKETALFLALLVFPALEPLRAQLMVYDVSFTPAPETPNFSFYEEGFFIVDAPRGTVSFILLSEEDGKPTFYECRESGEFFFGVSQGRDTGTIRARVSNETAHASYLATGRLNEITELIVDEQILTMAVPAKLAGVLLASDSNYYNESNGVEDEQLAIVGIAKIEATLNQKRTTAFNRSGVTSSEAMDYIVGELMKSGILRE